MDLSRSVIFQFPFHRMPNGGLTRNNQPMITWTDDVTRQDSLVRNPTALRNFCLLNPWDDMGPGGLSLNCSTRNPFTISKSLYRRDRLVSGLIQDMETKKKIYSCERYPAGNRMEQYYRCADFRDTPDDDNDSLAWVDYPMCVSDPRGGGVIRCSTRQGRGQILTPDILF